jgi:hypothetical protein
MVKSKITNEVLHEKIITVIQHLEKLNSKTEKNTEFRITWMSNWNLIKFFMSVGGLSFIATAIKVWIN